MAAAGRGRRQGYNNYSLQEQMLLCTVVEDILPLGRNMWERVADRFNADRTRGSPERDWESLRRKFRSLYGMPKPTGRNGAIPPRMKPILLAKEIQHKIEKEGGVHTSHDGLDEGEDDESFQQTVDEVTRKDDQGEALVSQQRPAGEAVFGLEGLGLRVVDANYAPDSDGDSAAHEEEGVVNTHHDGIPTEPRDCAGGAGTEANSGDSRNSPAEPPLGSLITRDGVVDAVLAAEFDISQYSPDEDVDESSQPAQQRHLQSGGEAERDRTMGLQDDDAGIRAVRRPETDGAQTQDAQTPASSNTRTARPTSERTPQRTAAASASPAASSASARAPRSAGRPRASRRDPLDTAMTPDGPILQRDPARAQADAIEIAANPSLNIGTNRLGGRDIRVMRDNLATLSESGANDNGKRSPASDATPSYGKNKRIRAKARLEELKRDIEALGKEQFSSGADMMQMLVFFQKDSDRRAEAEERRRREEREERREVDRLEREERERIRLEVVEATERRREQELKEARELREAQQRSDTAREAALALDREENRRRYEERLALERAEARERHEQLMLLLAKQHHNS